MDADEAIEIYEGLVSVLLDPQLDGQLDRVVAEVREVVAQGRPSAAEVRFAGQRKRERVQRVEPLTATEQLALLVDAVDFALVVPVDLAAAAATALATEEVPRVDLVFERDVATDVSDSSRSDRPDATAQQASITITSADIDDAKAAVTALRSAISDIRAELEDD